MISSSALALINRGSSGNDVAVRASVIGLLDRRQSVRNLWKQEDQGDFSGELTRRVQPHETILLKITSF